jgi:ATP-dependent Clp protease ATP-binding subunit ClpA
MPDVSSSGRYDRFTERARRSLTMAEEEARGLYHNYIGTEHLLLGLARVEEGVAARVLLEFDATADRIRSGVERVIGRGQQPSTGAIGLTPRAKVALDLAWDEAKRLNHHYMGTEHILLGILREGEGVAAGVLESLGVTLDQSRTMILKLLTEGPPSASDVTPMDAGHLIAQWMERERSLKRYNLALPEDLYAEVQSLADRQHTTVVELLRRFIKLGLLATAVQERRDAALIIREGDKEREILLL